MLKKLEKGDAQWITKKMVLGWAIDTDQEILMLPSMRRYKLAGSLAAIKIERQECLRKHGTESSNLRRAVP